MFLNGEWGKCVKSTHLSCCLDNIRTGLYWEWVGLEPCLGRTNLQFLVVVRPGVHTSCVKERPFGRVQNSVTFAGIMTNKV